MTVKRCVKCGGKFESTGEDTCPRCLVVKVEVKKVETKVKK